MTFRELMHEPHFMLDERQLDTLVALNEFREQTRNRWARPMDVGGKGQSHHSSTLRSLVRLGAAEKRARGSDRSYVYRITRDGRRELRAEGRIA